MYARGRTYRTSHKTSELMHLSGILANTTLRLDLGMGIVSRFGTSAVA
jgi:hypothetical protein